VLRVILASVSPDNTPHGYNLTFAIPMLMFIVIGGVLYMLLFSRPHRRVPARAGNRATATAATVSVAATQESQAEPAAATAAGEQAPADDAQAEAQEESE
jgi:hypothetical protein